jgi:hypothetical protein
VDAAKGDLEEIDEIDNKRGNKSKQHVKAEFEMVSHETYTYICKMIWKFVFLDGSYMSSCFALTIILTYIFTTTLLPRPPALWLVER